MERSGSPNWLATRIRELTKHATLVQVGQKEVLSDVQDGDLNTHV